MARAERQTWQIYGLTVDSDFQFPFPQSPHPRADLTLHDHGTLPQPMWPPPRRAPLDWQPAEDGWALSYCFDTGETLQFGFDSRGTTWHVRHTLAERRDALLLLLGVGFAAALHLRRIPILHAAAVAVDGSALLLLGRSGAGKSTLAGVLSSLGCRFLCDDLAALGVNDTLEVIPAHPWLKIDPAVSPLLGVDETALHPVFHGFPAYRERWVDTRQLRGGFGGHPAPLRAIYVLHGRRRDAAEARFDAVSPGRASLELTHHLYGASWLPRRGEDVLQLCADIARRIPVRRACVPDGLETLPRFGSALLSDFAGLGGPAPRVQR